MRACFAPTNRGIGAAILAAALLVSLGAPSAPVVAQEDSHQTQRRLNDEAASAAAAKDYDKAILLLRSALELGELNVTYLNLGRSYFLAGRCSEASEAYQKALSAPPVDEPPVEVVADAVRTFQAELPGGCAGELVVQCEPAPFSISIEGDDTPIRCGEPTALAPGTYQVVAKEGDLGIGAGAAVVGMQRTEIRLVLPAKQPAPPPEAESSLSTVGWVTLGAGIAVGAASLAYDQLVLGATYQDMDNAASRGDAAALDRLQSDFDSQSTTVWVLASTGAAATVVGAGILLYGHFATPASAETAVGTAGAAPVVGVWALGSKDLGVELGLRW